MKKLLLLTFIVAGLLSACSSDNYKITGKLEDGLNGTVHLKKVESRGLVDVSSAEVIEGSFTFEGSVEYPEFYLIFLDENQVPIAFFLENSNISITGVSEDLSEATVKGSKSNDIFVKVNDNIPHQDKVESISEEFGRAQATGDQEAMQSLMEDYQKIVEEQQEYYKSMIFSNNNVIGAFLALNFAQSLEAEELDEVVTKLSGSYSTHPYVEQLNLMLESIKLQAEIEAKLDIGKVAPNFTLTDMKGNKFSLEDLRGKYILLDFWAGWCQPCRIENPNLVKVYERFGGNEFEIVGISLDRSEEDMLEAVKEDGLTWTIAFDQDNEVATEYSIQSIPTTLLLDKNGVIIDKNLRGDAISEKLATLLD